MENERKPDNLARALAVLSSLLALVGLYFTQQTNQEKTGPRTGRCRRRYNEPRTYLRQSGRRYDFVDDASISQHMPRYFPSIGTRSSTFTILNSLTTTDLPRLPKDLQRYRSIQNLYSDVVVEATDDKRYHITAVGTSDRTYVDGQQPKVCQDETRSIRR